ncbi:SemiSWEET family transporter [Candidatus Cardinium hertigii]|jgi:MtN3 and saliva related transmembrane protein|uniref:Sugar transporter SemiSWEET n=1 Tax=Candidatus Cardinium hertigii TaxID=247481 RepID=A0A3N2QAS9_9BACT|nr:hypothetical protein EDM02_04940 [Candidatus Cardinium hertigii]
MLQYTVKHIEILGFIAAGLGTLSLLPQLIKIVLSRSTKSISLIMYIVITIDSLLWIIYGIALSLTPLIIQSSITLACAAAIIVLKLLWE